MESPDHKFSYRRDVMNAVGIDVSKGKSMVAIMQPCGVVVAERFEVSHEALARRNQGGHGVHRRIL